MKQKVDTITHPVSTFPFPDMGVSNIPALTGLDSLLIIGWNPLDDIF
jgi:hypothetical protein